MYKLLPKIKTDHVGKKIYEPSFDFRVVDVSLSGDLNYGAENNPESCLVSGIDTLPESPKKAFRNSTEDLARISEGSS